jgi:hypothetical protein
MPAKAGIHDFFEPNPGSRKLGKKPSRGCRTEFGMTRENTGRILK